MQVISPLLVVFKVSQQRVGKAGTTSKVTSEILIPGSSTAAWVDDQESFQSSEGTLQNSYAESDIGTEVTSLASMDTREISPDVLLRESSRIWNLLPL